MAIFLYLLFLFSVVSGIRIYPSRPDSYYLPSTLKDSSFRQSSDLIWSQHSSSARFVKNYGPAFKPHLKSNWPSSTKRLRDPQPLFITPYLESGKIMEARSASMVRSLEGSYLTSHSGFITVNKSCNSNLFFWFFLAEVNPADAPVVLWLQGGPGASSLYGLFSELGPFYVASNLSLIRRDYPWTKNFNMLFIDNPVGTGFSFTDKDEGYAQSQNDVARDMLSFLTQFFTLFNDLSKNEFFITGESYAGKYVPSIGRAIIDAGSPLINLKGIAVGNGLTDPKSMLPEYAPLLFNAGLLDENEFDDFSLATGQAVDFIDKGDYFSAFRIFDELLNGDLCKCSTFFQNSTGCTNYFNYLVCVEPSITDFALLFAKPEVRDAIHVGMQPFHTDETVERHLTNDIMQSVKPAIIEILNSNLVNVMIYNGALDVICGLPLEEAMLASLDWGHLDEYLNATKSIWRVQPSDTEVAGYVRHVHNLYQVAVRGAGHMVPTDQPRAAFDMINRFVFHKGFDS